MSQTLSYTITVTAEQARAEVERLQKEFEQSQSAAKGLDVQIAKLEKDFVDLSAAVKAGGANVEAYRTRLSATTAELNRMRGATASVAPTIESMTRPTRNVGMAFLDISRAVEDAQYGLRGIQNNIPGIIMSLGGGAGLTAAVSLGAVAFTQLYEKMTSVPEGAEKAAKAIAKSAKEIEDGYLAAADEVERLARGVDGLARVKAESATAEARAFGKEAFDPFGGEAAFRELIEEWGPDGARSLKVQDALTYTLDQMGKTAGKRGGKRISDEIFTAAQDALKRIDMLSDTEIELAKARGLRGVKESEDAAAKAAKDAAKKDPFADREAASVWEVAMWGGRLNTRDIVLAAIKANEDAAKAAEEAEEKAYLERASRREKPTEDMLAFGGEGFSIYKISEEAAKHKREQDKKIIKEHKQNAKAMADITVDAMGAVAEAIAGAASGQKDAWTDLLKYAAKAAGDIITLEGGKTLGTGIAALASGNPAGGAQIAAGLGIIAAGQAIAVGGAAAVGALSGQGSASSGARDRGASPSRASGGGEGGGLTVNVSYGVAGPLPEDTARAIAAAVRAGERRRGGR